VMQWMVAVVVGVKRDSSIVELAVDICINYKF